MQPRGAGSRPEGDRLGWWSLGALGSSVSCVVAQSWAGRAMLRQLLTVEL